MDYINEEYEAIKERIACYLSDLINDVGNSQELGYSEDMIDRVVSELMPYAIDGNFWWEDKSVKMAYYQMKNNVFIVEYNDFIKYYKELMGREYNKEEFNSLEKRKKIYKEADEKYRARKCKKR